MNANPPRRWFQFHLSTTLVLVFAAAGFIALNLLPSPPGIECLGLVQVRRLACGSKCESVETHSRLEVWVSRNARLKVLPD